jgi:hypothetical protein
MLNLYWFQSPAQGRSFVTMSSSPQVQSQGSFNPLRRGGPS